MIQDYYGLNTDAFSLSPDLDFLFISNSHEETLAHLAFGLEQNEDITLIIGDIGTGKTLALHRLLTQVSKSFVPVYISVTQLDFEQLMTLIMMKLEAPIEQNKGIASLLFSFEELLISYKEEGKVVLLIIDEAQNLPVESLESLRMLMNLAHPGKAALQIILVGQLDLRNTLDQPNMRQLRQRIRVEYQLNHLSRKETEAYINHRLDVACRTERLFKKSAFDKIYKYSQGVPRLVNHLATKALLNGYVDEAKLISGKHVEKFKDLEDLEESSVPPATGELQEEISETISPVVGDEEESSSDGRMALFLSIAAVIIVLAGFFTQDYWKPLWNEVGNQKVEEHVSLPLIEKANGIDQGIMPTKEKMEQEPEAAKNTIERGSEDVIAVDLEKKPVVSQLNSAYLVGFIGHVASFRDEIRAESFLSSFAKSSSVAFVRTVEVGAGDSWYRVYCGPYATEALAFETCTGLKNDGVIQYFAIEKNTE